MDCCLIEGFSEFSSVQTAVQLGLMEILSLLNPQKTSFQTGTARTALEESDREAEALLLCLSDRGCADQMRYNLTKRLSELKKKL